jgi:hypothetical protein
MLLLNGHFYCRESLEAFLSKHATALSNIKILLTRSGNKVDITNKATSICP